MSRPKILPDDVRNACIQYVRGYERLVREYYRRRREVLASRSCRRIEVADPESPGKTMWVYPPSNHEVGRGTEEMARRLEAIENRFDTKVMRAVEQARSRIGTDLPDDLRNKLADAIWLSCKNGRMYRYEILDVPGVGRSNFYERRKSFLVDIAKQIDFL